jgi:hypothetical protein
MKIDEDWPSRTTVTMARGKASDGYPNEGAGILMDTLKIIAVISTGIFAVVGATDRIRGCSISGSSTASRAISPIP